MATCRRHGDLHVIRLRPTVCTADPSASSHDLIVARAYAPVVSWCVASERAERQRRRLLGVVAAAARCAHEGVVGESETTTVSCLFF